MKEHSERYYTILAAISCIFGMAIGAFIMWKLGYFEDLYRFFHS